MENPGPPTDEGKYMSARERLSSPWPGYQAADIHAVLSDILNLSVSSKADEPNHLEWRVRVAVPVVKDSNVTLNGVARAVHQKLAGRLPDTYWNPIKERFVASFAIYDTSPESLEEVGRFAASLAEVLQPMTSDQPSMYLEYYGETIREVL